MLRPAAAKTKAIAATYRDDVQGTVGTAAHQIPFIRKVAAKELTY